MGAEGDELLRGVRLGRCPGELLREKPAGAGRLRQGACVALLVRMGLHIGGPTGHEDRRKLKAVTV
jgi:hypothetical protein